jgi:dTDP-4-dehydrorhamnose reductase
MGKANEGFGSRWKHFMKTIAIIGATGQLGTDLVKTFKAGGWKALSITHQDVQVENIFSLRDYFKEVSVDWIINTAAFHKVFECEKDSEKAWSINAKGQSNVTQVALEKGAKTAFISSDYVFSGDKKPGNAYAENDNVSPVNTYGHSKAAGEIATLTGNPSNLVIRIASVFGAIGSSGKGGNFVETIINKARVGEPLNVVDDIYMSPTYTVDASLRIFQAIDLSHSGIIHASNAGSATWYQFAGKILEFTGLVTSLTATETDWTLPLKRPKNSTLEQTHRIVEVGLNPSWEDALQRYLIEKGYLK